MTLQTDYSDRCENCLEPTARRLERFLKECLDGMPRIDSISVRAKSPDRFCKKAEKLLEDGTNKYSDPLNQIQDQVGARIVCFYLQDVEKVTKVILRYFRPIEERKVVPDSRYKFGYFGKHYILIFPEDVIDDSYPPRPNVFELQIKTLFQHAWSEADHDLRYKPICEMDEDFERRIAFTSAQAWGADQIFNERFMRASDNGNEQGG